MNKKTKDIKPVEETEIDISKLSAGRLLKEVRTKSQKTIEEVANDLKIRKVYLEAIEKSDYENIPKHPYGVAFVNSYAHYLGFDGVKMAEKFKQEQQGKTDDSSSEQYKKTDVKEETSAVPPKKSLMIALGALVLISIIWSFASGDADEAMENTSVETTIVAEEAPAVVSDMAETATNAEQSLEEVQQNNSVIITNENYVEEAITPAADASQSVAQTVAPKAENAPSNAPKIKVFEETWVEVKTKDKLFLSKVLQAGDEYVLPKREGLILSVGKINGADLFVGDKKMNVVSARKKINIPLDGFLTKEDAQ